MSNELAIWLTAFGTVGAVIVSLALATRDERRRVQRERRNQAELITAWLEPLPEPPSGRYTLKLLIENASHLCAYRLIASLVSVRGPLVERVPIREKGEGYRAFVGQLPPGRVETQIGFAGHATNLRFGIEIAFQDAAGRCWLRKGDGALREVRDDPVELYGLAEPVPWQTP